jgi:mono/diheme cytochrome c family protein
LKTTTRLLPFLLVGRALAAQDVTPSPTSGKEMYLAHCAACHGRDGKGDGPVAPALRKRPTDLTMLAKKNGGKFPGAVVEHELKSVYEAPHGSQEMPIWGTFFSDLSPSGEAFGTLRITNIVSYIQSLQAK